MSIKIKSIISLLLILPYALSALNGKCTGRNGICVSTSTCSTYGGSLYSGYCPNDDNTIKCCDNIGCTANGKAGKCVFTSQCSGSTYSGLCPGGSDFKCCVSSDDGGSGSSSSSKTVKQLVTSLLKFEEGTHKNGICYAYKDSRGYPTIGYGKLCKSVIVYSDVEASKACSNYVSVCTPNKAEQWLSDEIDKKTSCMSDYSNIKAAYDNASNYRKAVIISMAYQLGCSGLNDFKKTLNYMAKGDWASASTEMLDSAWGIQTPKRANRHSYVIKNNNCGNFCSNYGW